MAKRYLLGIDKGTSVIKAGLLDLNGNEVAMHHQRTPALHGRPGWHEEDMEGTWQVAHHTIATLMSKSTVEPDEIAAVGISGHMTGAWLIDDQGKPVRNAICWPDGRSIDLLMRWEHEGILERFFDISGNAATTGMTLVVLRWLKENEPQSLERARFVLCAKDWIRFKLTGEIHSDESDASHMPGDIRQRSYSGQLLDLCGLADYEYLFPPLLPSTAVVGGVLPDAAQATGLAPGTPVVVGIGDAVANSIGTGLLNEGQAASVLGTSFMNIAVSLNPILKPPNVGFEMAMVEGKWIRVLPNYGGGTLNLDWFIRNFCNSQAEVAKARGTSIFSVLEEEAAGAPLGSNGVIYHPYLNTTGVIAPFNNPTARGQFFGLSVQNTHHDLLHAVYEGVALSMLDCYQAIQVPIKEIRLTGGGAQCALWCQIISDCIGARLLIPSGRESGVMGAAITAGVGVELYPDFQTAVDQNVQIVKEFVPDETATAAYREIYGLYKKLREDLGVHWRLRDSIYRTLEQRGS